MFLMKIKIDPTGGYHYPEEVLEYIRAIAPGDIKGEPENKSFVKLLVYKNYEIVEINASHVD